MTPWPTAFVVTAPHTTCAAEVWDGDLIERAQPLEELGRLVTEARAGRGRLVLVGGEAGIGKTTLVRHFTQTLPAKVSLLWGACDPSLLPRPLGPLIDVAAAVGEGFRRLLELEAPRARLFSALRDVLGASTHVLVVEDVHWADDATLDLLCYLGRRLHTISSLLVATYRDDEIGPRHPLQVLLGDLATSGAARLKLEPLSHEAVRTLAAGSGLDARELYQRTGGNPFFVTEVLAARGTLLPPTLRDAVLARAARLSASGRRALEAAAVLGPRFPPALLAEIDAVDDDSVEECLGAGTLVREDGLVAFRHELSRDAILETIPPARGVDLHRKALAARRRLPANADSFATLAHHAEAAGDGEAVRQLAPRAARRAAELRSHREAAAQYERALRWADVLPSSERALLYESRSYECYLTNQFAEALSARQRAHAIWREEGDAVKVGESHRWLSRLSWFLGHNEDAERHARESLAVLEPAGPGPQLAWAYANLAQLHMLAGRAREAEDWGNRAIVLAERLGRARDPVPRAQQRGHGGVVSGNRRECRHPRRAEPGPRPRARARRPGLARLQQSLVPQGPTPAVWRGAALSRSRSRVLRRTRRRVLPSVHGGLARSLRVLGGTLRAGHGVWRKGCSSTRG
jgi:tetratricopeptide (TPR) repeat protein